MSNLPLTLEEMQYEILQGDLSDNPKLQASSIPALDRELKTKAKKVIPAINEILKVIENCKKTVELYSGQVEEKMNSMRTELENTLKLEYAKDIEERFNSLGAQIEQYITAQLKEQQTTGTGAGTGAGTGTGTGTGAEKMKRQFLKKVQVPIGSQIATGLKMTEIQDLEKQIVVTGYVQKTKMNTLLMPQATTDYENACAYSTTSYPADIRINPDTDEIIVANMGKNDFIVYLYEME